MSIRRDDDRNYGVARGGMAGGIALMIAAVLIGGFILKRMDRSNATTVVTAPTIAVPVVETTLAPITDPNAGVPLPTNTNTARTPADVRVIVVNATSIGKAALRVSKALEPGGWKVVKATDATVKNSFNDGVYFRDGFEQEARTILNQLGVTAEVNLVARDPKIVAPVPDFDIQVMVGPEIAKKYPAAASTPPVGAAPETTTTKAP